MTQNQQTDQVGDSKAPPLQPDAAGLRAAAEQAMTMKVDTLPAVVVTGPLTSAARAAQCRNEGNAPASCKQALWLSFFFDGTGNNLDADVGTTKHSNVAKLYRVHEPDDEASGVYRIYIPGVGTYFKEVGDDGGTTLGLGTGDMGDERLDWAIKQFEDKLKPHIARANSPANAILEVSVAAFGFSRGAALARAFVNRLLKAQGKRSGDAWRLKSYDCPLHVRFMGLFDTVASAGIPMSFNNTSIAGAVINVRAIINARLNFPKYSHTRPQVLAFAENAAPGADPSPGMFDGHLSYGGEQGIPAMVEEVRHFVAAHEIRNSFPVESVTIIDDDKTSKPAQFYESVYPGVHSDIGGSYRPGEGGRGLDAKEKLGLIPLHQMYEFASAKLVPLLPKTAWEEQHANDFAISETLLEHYRHYRTVVPQLTVLGPQINAHMRAYYAWRFRAIRLKERGDRTEADEINRISREFKTEEAGLKSRIEALEQKDKAALTALNTAGAERYRYLQRNYANPNLTSLPEYDARVAQAQAQRAVTRDAVLREKAKLDALPQMGDLATTTAFYDAQLLADARAIRDIYAAKGMFTDADTERYAELRPHYKALIDAYEDEYIRNKGLTDASVIAFFDNYVHDSLSGFAKDATLPSDPRVVYLGGDEKYRYAMLRRQQEQQQGGQQYALAASPPAKDAEQVG